jgi:predicted Zn-ribbon and HTH transcriptional regulator
MSIPTCCGEVVKNQAGGQEFFYCRGCKKEPGSESVESSLLDPINEAFDKIAANIRAQLQQTPTTPAASQVCPAVLKYNGHYIDHTGKCPDCSTDEVNLPRNINAHVWKLNIAGVYCTYCQFIWTIHGPTPPATCGPSHALGGQVQPSAWGQQVQQSSARINHRWNPAKAVCDDCGITQQEFSNYRTGCDAYKSNGSIMPKHYSNIKP